MKKHLLMVLVLSFQLYSTAQESKIFTRYSSMPEITVETKAKFARVPIYQPKKHSKNTNNTTHIDNSRLKYFPSIFNQSGNSCSQASGIRYIFSYEINAIFIRRLY